jgi:xanthine dehydrogenase accessory factor
VRKEIEYWHFVTSRLGAGQQVVLLVVAESSGSSPGRAGYKMAVAADGEMSGSIGGGVMEVRLVEKAKALLSEPGAAARTPTVIEQAHRKNTPNSSGMICSGRQAVILMPLGPDDRATVHAIVTALAHKASIAFEISNLKFQIVHIAENDRRISFLKSSECGFRYREKLGGSPQLIIIGGGHCALALSEVASRLGFWISIFDDRPELNTLAKNEFADEVVIVDSYANIADHVGSGEDLYVAVMTLGYASDALVIRKLIHHDLKYFGVLGSKAKMATLLKELREEGVDPENLRRIHTPIGIAINSRTPEEIAVSIAAEIISVKNA